MQVSRNNVTVTPCSLLSRDRTGARAVLGCGGYSTQFTSGPQSDPHIPRFPRPPYDPARSDFPSYGSDPGISSCCLPILKEA